MFFGLKNRHLMMVITFFLGFPVTAQEPQGLQTEKENVWLVLRARESHIELNKIEKKADEAIIYLLGDFYALGVLAEKGALGVKKAFREYRDVHCQLQALLVAGENEKKTESERLLCTIAANEAQAHRIASETAWFWGHEK